MRRIVLVQRAALGTKKEQEEKRRAAQAAKLLQFQPPSFPANSIPDF